ncbi:MAG TPA: hypothetical protein RMH99_06135 [Sandaracinaceae bacterium LLY-WYZ-13_1]|nr:hypothetical protein [Sandaracinaceae bacterium LLY-WYZ-13_1]
MTNEAPMTATMREGDAECNKEALAALAELLREEVDRRFALEGEYAERERVMHEVGNEVPRLVQEQNAEEVAGVDIAGQAGGCVLALEDRDGVDDVVERCRAMASRKWRSGSSRPR